MTPVCSHTFIFSGLTDRPQKPLASSATVSKGLRIAFPTVTWQLQKNAPVPPQLFSGYYRIGSKVSGSLGLIAAAPSTLRSRTLSMKTFFRLQQSSLRGNCCFQRVPIARVPFQTQSCPGGHGVPLGAVFGTFALMLFDQQQAAAAEPEPQNKGCVYSLRKPAENPLFIQNPRHV